MTGITEKLTRKELIDPALFHAGWDVANPNQVGIEIPVDGFDPDAWQQLQQLPTVQRSTYFNTHYTSLYLSDTFFQDMTQQLDPIPATALRSS